MADTITDLLVGLGVKVQPQTIETLKAFDKYVRKATIAVKTWGKQDTGLNKVSASILTMTRVMKGLNAQLEALGKNQTALSALSKVKIVNSGDKSGLVRTGTDTAAQDNARAARAAEVAERRRKQEEAREIAMAAKKAAREQREAEVAERRKNRQEERARLIRKRAFEEEVSLGNAKRNREANAQAREEQRRMQAALRWSRESQKEAKRESLRSSRNIGLLEQHRAKLANIGASASVVDKATLAFQREKEAIRAAAAVTGDHAGAVKALAAAEKKYADALARDAAKSDKMRIKAAKETNSFMSNVKGAAGPIGVVVGLLTAMGTAAVGAAYGIGQLGYALAENSLIVAQDALKIERQAQMFGLSAKAYQTLRYQMGLFGVDQRDISDLFGQLAQMVQAAAEGGKTASGVFKTLGLDAKQMLQMKPEEQIYAIADAAGKVENVTLRTAALSSLVGEDLAKKVGPLWVQGSEYMRNMSNQAERLGVVMSDKDVDAARQLTTAWVKLTTTIDGLRISIGNKLIPILTNLANRLLAWYDVNKDIIAQGIDRFAKEATAAFKELGKAGDYLDRIFGGMDGFFDFMDKLVKYTSAAVTFAIAFQMFASAAVTIPIAAIIALAVALQDIYIWMTGGISVFGPWFEKIKASEGLLGALIRVTVAWGHIVKGVGNIVVDSVGWVYDKFMELAGLLWELFKPSWWDEAFKGIDIGLDTLIEKLTTFLDYLAQAYGTVAAFLGEPVESGAKSPSTTSTGGFFEEDNQSFDTTFLAPKVSSPAASGQSASARGTKGGTVTITIGGANINGSGLNETQLRAILSDHANETGRQVQQALIGMPV